MRGSVFRRRCFQRVIAEGSTVREGFVEEALELGLVK